jgi:glyoxylase I family protein
MAGTPPFALEGIDHVVLLVDDMAAARAFYLDVIGCTVEKALPQYGMLQLRAGAPGAWARPPAPGGRNVDHVCLATGPWEEGAMRAWLAAHDVAIVEEGVNNGARGESLSFYVKDPAGNTIELTGPPEATRGAAGRSSPMATTPQPEVPQPSQAPEPAAPPPEVYPPQHDIDVPDPHPADPGPGTG